TSLVVFRVLFDARKEFARVTDIGGFFGQRKRGFRRLDFRIVARVRAHEAERLAGAFKIAALDVAARKARNGCGIAGLELDRAAKGLRGGGEVMRLKGRMAGFYRLFGRRRADAADKTFDEGADLAFGQRAHEAINRLAILE